MCFRDRSEVGIFNCFVVILKSVVRAPALQVPCRPAGSGRRKASQAPFKFPSVVAACHIIVTISQLLLPVPQPAQEAARPKPKSLCLFVAGARTERQKQSRSRLATSCMNDVPSTGEANAKVMEYLLRCKCADDGLAPDLLRCQLKVDGLALKTASEELQNNRSIVQQAVKENGLALQYASHELRGDKDIVLKAIRCSGGSLAFASPDLRDDFEVVFESVQDCGGALEFASETIRSNKTVVLAAVQNYGGALEFASRELQDDDIVVREAIRSYAFALEFASDRLKSDRFVVSKMFCFQWISILRSLAGPLCWKLQCRQDWLSVLLRKNCELMVNSCLRLHAALYTVKLSWPARSGERLN